MSSSQRSKFVSDCCNFYDCFVNYIENYLDEADLKSQINILSPFCLLNLNFPNYNDYMQILENFGELCDIIDPDLLLDEVVTLENSKNNITSNESFLSLTTSAERWKYIGIFTKRNQLIQSYHA